MSKPLRYMKLVTLYETHTLCETKFKIFITLCQTLYVIWNSLRYMKPITLCPLCETKCNIFITYVKPITLCETRFKIFTTLCQTLYVMRNPLLYMKITLYERKCHIILTHTTTNLSSNFSIKFIIFQCKLNIHI